MPIVDLTRDDLQAMALGFVGETLTQNHYATQSLKWLDKGLKMMYDHTNGIQATAPYTLVPNQRYYRMPRGFVRERRILINNMSVEYRSLDDLDYYAQGASLPGWYSFWGKPATHIYLGPQAPDSNYPMLVFYYRLPRSLTQPNSVPELPPQFQEAPAYWAAAMLLQLEDQFAQARELKDQFYQERAEFTKWYENESGNGYLDVAYVAEY